MTTKLRHLFALAALLVIATCGLMPDLLAYAAQEKKQQKEESVPDLTGLLGRPHNEMAVVVSRFNADLGNLNRFYGVASAPGRFVRMKRFYSDWQSALQNVNAEKLSGPARTDLESLQKRIAGEITKIDSASKAQAEITPLLPFEPILIELLEAHQRLDKMDGMKAAGALNTAKLHIQEMRKNIANAKNNTTGFKATKAQAELAADTTAALRKSLNGWYGFYNLYDPMFTWWTADLYKEVDKGLGDYATLVRGKAVDVTVAPSKAQLPDWVTFTDKKNPRPQSFPMTPTDVPDLAKLVAHKPSEMRDVLARFQKDRGGKGGGMGGGVGGGMSLEKATKTRDMWIAALAKIDFNKLSQSAKVDYVMIKHNLDRDVRRAEMQVKASKAMAQLLPFEPIVDAMEETIRKDEKPASATAAKTLADLVAGIEKAHATTETAFKNKDATHPVLANRIGVGSAIDAIKELRDSVKKWVALGSADEEFSKQAVGPAKDADAAMQKYSGLLTETGTTKPDGSGISGRPIGRDALMMELFSDMIALTPEELIIMADKEYAWCKAEMLKASRELGCGDDWQAAVEKVKRMFVAPGDQPEVIRDLVWEAIHYLNKHDLITVPSVASETWLMQMMSPQRQLTTPFFTGGATISVSYPTNTMPFDARMQSMRGNNPHFSRATAHHEVIPGHNLQGFLNSRAADKRGGGTPFWTEGGALYWEFVLYEKGFPKAPEDRIGFLVWRMHRCCRIQFSLNFHMGKWTPKECVDYLMANVGFDYENAAGEVRRSFGGGYGPLYQLAYMTGGKQIYALRKELVLSGKMKEKEFHDKIWYGGAMPIELVRALVAETPLTPEWTPTWRFDKELYGN